MKNTLWGQQAFLSEYDLREIVAWNEGIKRRP